MQAQSLDEFCRQVADAYDHLYDLVYLRAHPLAEFVASDPTHSRREKAWRLHRVLLDVIEELNPGPQAPTFSREWRRHRLMLLRYQEGLDPQTVAEQLAISRRHYYREQERSIQAISTILWNRYASPSNAPQLESRPEEDEASLSYHELLRREVTRAGQAGRPARLDDELQGVISLLQERLRERALTLEQHLLEPPPAISVDRNLLRQILLGLMGYLVEHAEQATIRVTMQAKETSVTLNMAVEPPTAVHSPAEAHVEEGLSASDELAALAHIPVHPLHDNGLVAGFEVELPTVPPNTILVVDDNEDVLELFRRYLSTQPVRVATARTAREALAKARQLQPHAITLDLMMPQQDGWDLLQTLLNQPETQHIPIVVCSVLKQEELALALGATEFLAKPITEQALLSVLTHLEVL
ncbi:MAG: response regulator [Anaerolineae bacterium]|nr:response regulator [Anaerolineae bacterium]